MSTSGNSFSCLSHDGWTVDVLVCLFVTNVPCHVNAQQGSADLGLSPAPLEWLFSTNCHCQSLHCLSGLKWTSLTLANTVSTVNAWVSRQVVRKLRLLYDIWYPLSLFSFQSQVVFIVAILRCRAFSLLVLTSHLNVINAILVDNVGVFLSFSRHILEINNNNGVHHIGLHFADTCKSIAIANLQATC